MSRVLIVKLGAIGDVIMAIPAVNALRQEGAQIDWICGPAVAPLLACYPWIRPIVADDRAILKGSAIERLRALTALWREIGFQKYDLCATLYYDPRYRLIALPVRAKRKLLLSNSNRTLQLLPGRHHTDEYARILLGLKDEEQPSAFAPVQAALVAHSRHLYHLLRTEASSCARSRGRKERSARRCVATMAGRKLRITG
jgi:heptosyltransferase-2